MHTGARLGEQRAHGAPRITLNRELAPRRRVLGESFAQPRQTLHQRTVAVGCGAGAQHRQGGLQFLVELVSTALELITRGACFIERGEGFAERAQFDRDASHATSIAL